MKEVDEDGVVIVLVFRHAQDIDAWYLATIEAPAYMIVRQGISFC